VGVPTVERHTRGAAAVDRSRWKARCPTATGLLLGLTPAEGGGHRCASAARVVGACRGSAAARTVSSGRSTAPMRPSIRRTRTSSVSAVRGTTIRRVPGRRVRPPRVLNTVTDLGRSGADGASDVADGVLEVGRDVDRGREFRPHLVLGDLQERRGGRNAPQ
jgi:hypothetical protein